MSNHKVMLESGDVYLHYKEDKEYIIYRTDITWAEDNEGEQLITYIDKNETYPLQVFARRYEDFFAVVEHPKTGLLMSRFRPKL